MFRLLLDFLSWPGNLLSSPYPSFFPALFFLFLNLLSFFFSSFLLLFLNLFPLDYSGITSFFSFRSMILLPLSLLGHSHFFAYLDRYEWCFLPLVVHHHLARKWTGNPKKCMIEKLFLTSRKRERERENEKVRERERSNQMGGKNEGDEKEWAENPWNTFLSYKHNWL